MSEASISLRKAAKQIPGVRPAYIALMRAKRVVRRAVFGPTKAERYDIDTREVLRRVLSRDSVCVDLGANNGEILQMMLEFAPEGRHHAVEALPQLAARLGERFPGVTVHACAVSDAPGEREFQFVENHPAYSGLKRRVYPRADYEVRPITVPVRRLDDLLPTDARVRLIKADIEGGEYNAFQGAREVLRRCRPFIVFEFAAGSAGCYDVSPEMMYALLRRELSLNVSTMDRWLAGLPPLAERDFADSFRSGTDFYYLAYP
jgi:FkbM family methyltransferase